MVIPPFLKPGDKVAIIATARAVQKEKIDHAVSILNSWGLDVICGKNLLNQNFRFAGDDEERAGDLQWALSNKDIKAVFCARGGYGTTRIIDSVDLKSIYKFPKWFLGFSDITSLLLSFERMSVASAHSSMPGLFQNQTSMEALQSIRDFLLESRDYAIEWSSSDLDRPGDINGQLLGGNLSMIANNIGTISFPLSFKNKVLFIEEVGEDLYRLDRSMVQLKRAGVLKDLAGLIVGGVSDTPYDEEPFGLTENEIIKSHVEDYDYPVYFNAPFGHIDNNFLIPSGMDANISASNDKVVLSVKK